MSKLLKQSSFAMVGEITSFAGAIALGIATARWLGPEGKGTFNLVVGMSSIAALCLTLQLQRSIAYYTSTNTDNVASVSGTSLALGVIAMAIFLLIWLLFPAVFEEYVFKSIPARFILISALMIYSAHLWFVLNGMLAGMQFFKERAMFLSAAQWVKAIVVVVACSLGVMDVGVILTWILITSTVLNISWLVSVLVRRKIVPSFNLRFSGQMLGYAASGFLGAFFNVVLFRVDSYFINYFSGTREVGFYTVSVSLSGMLMYLPNAIQAVILPHVASSDDRTSLASSKGAIRSVIAITIVAGAVLVVAAFFLVEPIYGSEFRSSLIPCYVLVPGTVAWAAVTVMAADFSGRGRPALISIIAGISGLVTIALDLRLIPEYGALGAAIARAVGCVLGMVIAATMYAHITGSPLREFLVIEGSDIRSITGKIGGLLRR